MRVQLHPDAEAELLEAALWYEGQRRGLGEDLLIEVEHWLEVLPETPSAWPKWLGAPALEPPIRCAVLRRFPFTIAYQAFEGCLRVLAFAHTSRRPLYWSNRLDDDPDQDAPE